MAAFITKPPDTRYSSPPISELPLLYVNSQSGMAWGGPDNHRGGDAGQVGGHTGVTASCQEFIQRGYDAGDQAVAVVTLRRGGLLTRQEV